ncbi:SLIT-ROBO Rho GTPase-activating protein 1-like isoform X3 [Gigantopelta aegis]|uniref:SLIT-ROBO Rho GTPase-activating protein 1-like isoform X3 n=1 Tax=Gigantopelta aegis TaxID=1735272 RepID=UPI001B88BC7F|nr:SLIT-ROBO Rho GTPase-activating protein 1-like isoform X3 [Gigantopelta aegis]
MPPRNRYSSLLACTRPVDDFLSEVPHIFDIRAQLGDQLKCLDNKLEIQVAIVAELQEFFKRRAEVELEYSKNLDKLVKQMISRHRAEKQTRQEQWATFSTFACWKLLLGITRKQSQDHSTISEIYANTMVQRLSETMDNSQRIFRKCRDIGAESHEDMLKVLNELQSAMKTYHAYQSESKQAETKLRSVEGQKLKVEQQLSGKNLTSSRKLKRLEREAEKRQAKYSGNKLKALKARNDYLLCIEAANAAITKYFSDDTSDLMDCMDFGYHNSVGQTMMMYLSIHEHLKQTYQSAIESINKNVSDLDSRVDKQKFMELNNSVFMLPKKFEFQPFKGDEDVVDIQSVRQISAQKPVQDDLVQRYQSIGERLGTLKVENDEIWKTLETTEKTLVDMIQVKDYDVSKYFQDENPVPKSPHEAAKQRSDRLETESYYLTKFREYTLSCNRLARLQAKHGAIQKALGENGLSSSGPATRPPSLPPKPKKRRIGRTPPVGQPKLFGGSLEEYIEASGQEIPQIIRSCVRIINLYGMHHQGIFRVSGSQLEIIQFKASFEAGDDPLMDVIDASDINSVAGVLKLYFRELREPLFPLHLFDELVACTREDDTNRRVDKIRDLLMTLPRPTLIVMRYLFAFLNHLSEYSDENMMDPYNLAICFGPTLLPIPPDRDQVSYQASTNEIIKTIITNHEAIFPNDGGEVYEKCILESRDTMTDHDGDDTSSIPSDEEGSMFEPDLIEATALYDFEGRTDRELSFKKGEQLIIYQRASDDWWEGCCHGREGLIPDKYVFIKAGLLDEQKSHSSEEDKMSSTHSLPTKPPVVRQLSEESTHNDSKDSSEKAVTTQPHIVIRETDIINVEPETSPPSTPHTDIGTSQETSLSSVANTDIDSPEEKDLKRQLSSSESVADDISDIDNALEEVMLGLKSLEMQQKSAKRMSLPVVKAKQTPKHTPDLVLDLPAESATSPSSQDSNEPDSPTISAAETFAKSNQGTLKKANSMPRNISVRVGGGGGSDANHPPPDGSAESVPLSSFSSSIMRRSLNSSQVMKSAIQPSGVRAASPGTVGPSPPPVAEKPKPLIKAKPPVMKKPMRPEPAQDPTTMTTTTTTVLK